LPASYLIEPFLILLYALLVRCLKTMRALICGCIVFTLFTPLYGAEREDRAPASAPCGQEHHTKKHFGRKLLGLPGAVDKAFSDLALSVSSIGIPQARCEVESIRPQKSVNTAKRRTSEPERM
jgi:hypothetical protein